MKIKGSEDPELFIHNIEKLSMRKNEDFFMSIGDDYLSSKVLNSLIESYESLVDSIHIQMNSKK